MPQTSVATGTYPSRKAARQAVDRLVSGGFARNSIELHRHEEDEGYDLRIHARAENIRRARRLMRAPSSSMLSYAADDLGQMADDTVRIARSHPLILFGAGLLAGFVMYNLIPRSSARGHMRNGHGSRGDATGRHPDDRHR